MNNKRRIANIPLFLTLAKTTNYVSHAGAIPFLWSHKSGELGAKKTRKIFTLLKHLVLSLQVLFVLYQLCNFARAKDVPIFGRIYVFYTTLAICIAAYNVSMVYRDPGPMQGLVNNLVRTSLRFHGQQLGRATTISNSKSVIRAVRLTTCTCTFIMLTYSIRIIRDPGNNRYLTSLLSNPENSSTALRAVVGLFHMAAIGFEYFVTTFTGSFSFVFVCVVVDIMKRLRLHSSGIEVPSNAELGRVCKYAEEMWVLTQHFNSIYGTFMLTLELLLIVAIVVNTTFAVLHASARGMVIASTLFIIVIYAYKIYGSVYEESMATWESWKRGGRSSAWFRRFCRAYRPPRVAVGSFFYADKSLTLTILSIVLNNTVSMALTAGAN